MTALDKAIQEIIRDIVLFAQHGSGVKLRRYQEEVARAVVDSVIHFGKARDGRPAPDSRIA